MSAAWTIYAAGISLLSVSAPVSMQEPPTKPPVVEKIG